MNRDEHFMRLALQQAQLSFEREEIPVGVVVVHGETLIARGHNLTETLNDVTAHAEMQAITASAEYLGGKYLRDCTMYVTLEPCVMCAGALSWAQISRVVWGAPDPHRGFRAKGIGLHPKTVFLGGVLEEECRHLLNEFFKKLR